MFKVNRLFSFRVSAKTHGRIRFTALGFSGFITVRQKKSRGYGMQHQAKCTQLHLGRISIALKYNTTKKQKNSKEITSKEG